MSKLMLLVVIELDAGYGVQMSFRDGVAGRQGDTIELDRRLAYAYKVGMIESIRAIRQHVFKDA